MTQRSGLTTPWVLARLAQGAVAVAAVADVFRAVELRDQHAHRTDASSSGSGFASMVFVYVMTVTVVLFLMWFTRCRRIARALAPGAVTGSEPWAVASWLIPVINLWAPRRLVLEVRDASAGGASGRRRDGILVNCWWAAWAGHAVVTAVTQAGDGVSMPALLLSEALMLTAAVLAILVVQRVTGLQSAALSAVAAGEPATLVRPPLPAPQDADGPRPSADASTSS
ncbi:DUF4328 domain-containing protein [Streptomyces sp. NPDC008313]|uniref:DUF4328 domain-containing protein n=1 Tax=Streptomyces sp. NPDC008313 TaxID=3364826 RepID=UPI0036E141E4